MRRVVMCLIAVGVALAVVAGAAARTPPAAGPVAASGSSTRSGSGLALAMLRGLNPGANVVISPDSLATALEMVDQGASGETATQLNTLLGVANPAGAGALNASTSSALHHAVTGYGAGGPTLDTANGLWLQSGLTLQPAFSHTLSTRFGAAPQRTDFAGGSTGAIKQINGWISQRTAGLIPALMSPRDITPQTNVVLANAVYLNARWQSPFDPDEDSSGPFMTPTGSVTVPYMDSGQLSSYPYASGSGFQAVALPYAHSSLQFLAVMPPAGTLATFEKSLTPTRLSAITSALRTRTVDLKLPKLSLSFHTSLIPFLQSQGVTRAFGPASQLNRIVQRRSLAVQAVEQEAVLKVAENGTVAAAATGLSGAPTAIAAQGVLLQLDHPFLVFLRDSRTGTILFAARVEDPSAS